MSGVLPQEDSHVPVPNIFTEDDFGVLEELQSGGEATCYKAISAKFGEVCIKRFHTNALKTGLKKELIVCLQYSDHPNLIRFFGCYENIQRVQRIGYVMEYMPGGSLHDVIYSGQTITFARACNWMTQAGRGLEYLHTAGIIHRDVKPRNMLLDRHLEILKLSDFGLAKNIGKGTSFNSNEGTVPYMAPEVLHCGDGNGYSYPSDVYSLGITFWELLHRREPYMLRGYDLTKRVVDGGERPVIGASIGSNTKNLLQRTWAHVPNNRCSLMDIIKFTSQRGVIHYPDVTNQQPAHTYSHSQPNIPKVSPHQPPRAVTVPQPVRRLKTLRLEGPPNSQCIPKYQNTVMSQTHELIAFLFPLCPHKFQAVIQTMFAHALEFEQHLNDPVALLCNKPFNVCCFKANGQICDPETTTLATSLVLTDIPEMSQSWDYNAFNWPRTRFFLVSYWTQNVNQCSAVKVDNFKKLLLQLEKLYNNYQQQFRTLLAQTRFNCLIVGDWKHSRQFFNHLKSDADDDSPMKLYDMNYHFYRVRKNSCLSHDAKGIIEKISEIGPVHKIIYLVATNYDPGQFGSEWEPLLKPINATVWLVLSEGNVSNRIQRAQLEGEDFLNRINYQSEKPELGIMFSDGRNFLTNLENSFYLLFSDSYADCINKLAFGVAPLMAVAE